MSDYRQIKYRLTKEEQAGMDALLARVREKREEATKATTEDVKNVAGVRQEADLGFLT